MMQVILRACSGPDSFQQVVKALITEYLKFNFGILLTNYFSQSFLLIRK